MTTEKKLLVRPNKHPFERIDDYLIRLADRNGFSSEEILVKHLREWTGAGKKRINRFDKANTLARMLSKYLNRKVESKSFDQPAFTKAHKRMKTCRTCFSENRTIMFYWHLDDYSYCHIHNEQLIQPDAAEKPYASVSEPTSHPIVDFLDRNDPWAVYSLVQKNTQELKWLCGRLKQFFGVHLSTRIRTTKAQCWVDQHRLAERPIPEKFDLVTHLVAWESGREVEETRLIAALLLWHRMVPDYLFSAAGSGAAEATETSLDWASRQLMASESMLTFICDARHAPKNTPKLQISDYIPLLAGLDEVTDRELRRAVVASGLTTELTVKLPFRAGRPDRTTLSLPHAKEDVTEAALI